MIKRIIISFIAVILLHNFASPQQNIDIGIFKSTISGEVDVKLKPDFIITGSILTNVQFTVRWDSSANVSINPSSIPPYLINPQGAAVNHNGYMYQTFASSPNCTLNWNSGQEYVVLSFTHSNCVEFELVQDTWTQANNGDFYTELLGVDHTGVFYHPVTEIIPVVYLGKDTSICVYNNLELDAGNPGSGFLWSNGETTQKISVDASSLGVGAYNYGVTVTAQNGCTASDSRLVIIDPCTGMNDIKPNNIDIFPNPTNGEIFINTADKSNSFQIKIFDLCGIIVSGNIYANNLDKHTLDLSNLSPGVYLLKLSCNEFSCSERIVLMN